MLVFWHSPIGSRTIKRIFRLGRRSVKYKTLLTLTIIIIHRISTFMSVSKNARYKFHTRKYILSKLLDTFYLASQLFGIYTLPIQNLINVFLIPHSLTFGQDDLIRPKLLWMRCISHANSSLTLPVAAASDSIVSLSCILCHL